MNIQVEDARPREAKSITPNGMITRYEITSHYGGPEEGGWWYERYEAKDIVLVFSEAFDIEQKRVVCRALNNMESKRREDERERPEHQGGPPRIAYNIEDNYGEDDNMDEPRPHYE